ncbi:MAG TPA: putative Ig domain-containing protein, partial [Bryobacteraceae bacterium]
MTTTTSLSGTPTTAGQYSFVISEEYTTSANMCSMQSYTVTIAPAPPQFQITTSSLPAATVGNPYSQQLQTVSARSQVNWYVNCPSDANCVPGGIVAPGLTLDGSSGLISGTPTTVGTYTAHFQAEFSFSATETANKTLTINVMSAAPTCTASMLPASGPLPPGDIDIRFPPVMFSVGGCPGPFTFSVDTNAFEPAPLPNGITLNNYTLGGTASQTGTFNFSVTATGPSGPNQVAVSNSYSLVINPLPTITTPSPLPNATVGAVYSQQISATGGVPSTSGYVFSMNNNPPGLTITPGGLLNGTPTQTGQFSFNIAVRDSLGGQSSSPFQITAISGSPQILVSPLSLTFNADLQGTPPPTQAVAVTPVAGATPPVTFTTSVDGGQAGTPAPSWISVSQTSANAPAGLVVGANQTGLAAGSYQARIHVTDSSKLQT